MEAFCDWHALVCFHQGILITTLLRVVCYRRVSAPPALWFGSCRIRTASSTPSAGKDAQKHLPGYMVPSLRRLVQSAAEWHLARPRMAAQVWACRGRRGCRPPHFVADLVEAPREALPNQAPGEPCL